jgi:ABC-type amino acid transport substrate-binding protein
VKPLLWPLPFVLLALTGCGTLPGDASGTTERMTRTGEMRIAVLPATPDAAPALAMLRTYARSHDARLMRISGHGEHALRWLEEGKVDAVVGHFAKASPWQAEVALSKAVGRREPDDSKQPVLRIARRNGENALILAIDRAIAELGQ